MKQLLSIACVIGLTVALRSFFHVEGVDMAIIGAAIFSALAAAAKAAVPVVAETAAAAGTTATAAAPAVVPTIGAGGTTAGIGGLVKGAAAVGSKITGPVAGPTTAGGGAQGAGVLQGLLKPPQVASRLIGTPSGAPGLTGLEGLIESAASVGSKITGPVTPKPGLLDILGKKFLSTVAGSSVGFQVGNSRVNVGPSRERRLRRSMRMLRSGSRGSAFLDELIGATMLEPNTDRARAVTSPMRGA